MEFRPVADSDLDIINALVNETREPGYEIDAAAWRMTGRALADGGRLHAAVRLLECPQYYGGRPVSAAAPVEGVVNASERRRGYGRQLLVETHRELARRNIALASGYPAVPAYNRTLGWETAGIRARYQCRASDFSALRARRKVPDIVSVAPWDLRVHAGAAACYDAVAKETNGHYQRTETWWHDRVLAPALAERYRGHLVLREGIVIGYVIYRLALSNRGTKEMPIFDVDCAEVVATTADAITAAFSVLEHAADPSSIVAWWGGSVDPVHLFLGQAEIQQMRPVMYITRILDLKRALEQRGYPHALTATLSLAVRDVGAPTDSRQTVRIAVRDGHAEVTEVAAESPPAAETDIGTLAAIYAGWLSPEMAARLGRLEASRDTLDSLGMLLPVGPSWTREHV